MENPQPEKHDITTQADIILLVNTFYQKVRNNSTLNFIFEDVAKVDWPNHLPKMYAFWGGMLLGDNTYKGDPMTRHVELSRETPIGQPQFAAWLSLFVGTIDELFVGEKAREAKMRAGNIAGLMMHKIQAAKL